MQVPLTYRGAPRPSAEDSLVTTMTHTTLGDRWIYDAVLAAQLALLAAAAAGIGVARYYVLVTWATVVALVNYLRRGVPATWQPAEGTR